MYIVLLKCGGKSAKLQTRHTHIMLILAPTMFTFRLERLAAVRQLNPQKLNTYRCQSVSFNHLLMNVLRLTTVFCCMVYVAEADWLKKVKFTLAETQFNPQLRKVWKQPLVRCPFK